MITTLVHSDGCQLDHFGLLGSAQESRHRAGPGRLFSSSAVVRWFSLCVCECVCCSKLNNVSFEGGRLVGSTFQSFGFWTVEVDLKVALVLVCWCGLAPGLLMAGFLCMT
ncbi:hypothetical protein M758_8G019100 [Ceratodon purpureus]|nr:hypothetical protein M758_8G019100 [Ceratodon purpureus]